MTSSVLPFFSLDRSAHDLQPAARNTTVFFTRHELDAILKVYGRMVAKGEWRDYAIDYGKEMVGFAVFRRTSEMPLFRIEKHPRLTRKQGAYVIIGSGGQVLRRGTELEVMLRYFVPKTVTSFD